MIKINENIYQAVIPYKDIWTTVTLIKTEIGDLLFDSASFDSDAENYTIPFLKECGVTKLSLKYIFISHNHLDHAGGLAALIESFPDTVIISGSDALREAFSSRTFIAPKEGEMFLDVLKAVKIVGHTIDSAALFDMRTKTLISGDCLQAVGIVGSGAWAANISYPVEYFAALDKVGEMDIEKLITAHNYFPFTKNIIEGKDEIKSYISYCYKAILELKDLILDNPALDDEGICALHNVSKDIPSFGTKVVKQLRQAITDSKF